MEPLIETWLISQRINLYLLDALPDEQLSVPLAKGKTVVGGFTHIHNVRLMWLKPCAPDLLGGQVKCEGDIGREELRTRLNSSGDAIAEVLRRAGSPDGKVRISSLMRRAF